jgi:outer membrane receptor for ferrienterochelin and colicins
MRALVFLIFLLVCASATAEEQSSPTSEVDSDTETTKEDDDNKPDNSETSKEDPEKAPSDDQEEKKEESGEEESSPKGDEDSASQEDQAEAAPSENNPEEEKDIEEKSNEPEPEPTEITAAEDTDTSGQTGKTSESALSSAKRRFEGIVLDPTGNPVGGAKVGIEPRGITTTSAEDGTVVIEIEPGTYPISVESKGLEPFTEVVALDESAAISGFELLMEFPIGDVVVTGTKTEKLAAEAPVKTQVVARKQIERKKATNLADALETTSGIRVENNCQNCNFTQVRLNGLEGRYTQILIDGRPVFSGLAGVYGLEQIPEEMIERIEIVKGGGSALYGGNAVGGVVNVITARPRANFGNLTLRGGAVGIEEPELRVSASSGLVNDDKDMAIHVFGGAYTREPWDANGDGFSEIGKVRQVMAGAETYLDVLKEGELQLKFHVLREQRRGGDSFDKPEHDAAIAESIHTMRYGGELRFHQLVTSHFNYDLGYGVAYTERDSYYGGGGDIAMSSPPTADEWEAKQAAMGAYGRTKNPVHTGDATVNFAYNALGEQIVTAGVQYLSDGLDDRFPAYGRRIDERYWDVAGILQHDWMYTDWAESIIGVRLDKHSELEELIASPRAALMFTPLEWLRTRTSFSTGFRAPQVFDEDLHITIVGGEGQIIYNDEALSPERSYSVAQQIELNFDLSDDWTLKTSINGFYTLIKDAFVLDEDDDPTTMGEIEMYRRNSGDTTVWGMELEAGIAFKQRWGLSGGWTYEQAENSEADPDFNTHTIFRTPEMYGFFETWAKPVGNLEVSSGLDITGSMKVPHYAGYIAENRMEVSPWFVDWSANLSYRFDIKRDVYLTPFVGIRNILDSRQEDYDIGPDRDAGYVYGPRLPRTLFAGIKGGI